MCKKLSKKVTNILRLEPLNNVGENLIYNRQKNWDNIAPTAIFGFSKKSCLIGNNIEGLVNIYFNKIL